MKNNLDNTLEIVMENGEIEIFYIYFTFVFLHKNYVIYYHPHHVEDLYVKEYDDLTQSLAEPSAAALDYAETLIEEYESDSSDDINLDGNFPK